jgi:hypothetical protein
MPLIANGTLWQLSAFSLRHPTLRSYFMVDRDRVEGSLEQGKGKVKEVIGKVTGDKKTEGEGSGEGQDPEHHRRHQGYAQGRVNPHF